MNAKSIIFGLLIVAAVAALFYFFVVKPKTGAVAAPETVSTVNTDGTVTTRAVRPRQIPCVCGGYASSSQACYQNCYGF